jgi:VanZ family protein
MTVASYRNLQHLHRIWLRLIIVTGGIVLLCATLFPFALDWPASLAEFRAEAERRINWAMWSPGGWKDSLANVLLSVPLGFGLAGMILARKSTPARAITVATAFVGLVSLGVEAAQLLLPSRSPALGDFFANFLGGFAGAVSCCLFGTALLAQVTRLVTAKAAITLSSRRIGVAFAGYAAIVFTGSLLAARNAPLDSWDPDMPLAIGNEHANGNAWRGEISGAIVADRAMNLDEIRRTLKQSTDNADPYGGRVPPADYCNVAAPDNRHTAARIKASSSFTVSAVLSPAEKHQVGPARIVSIAGKRGDGNLILGQQNAHLIIRLQSPLTRSRSDSTQFILAYAFAQSAARRFSVTFDGRHLQTYVDDRSTGSVDLSPELAFVWRWLPFRPMSVVLGRTDALVWRLSYAAVVFAPLGLLAGLFAAAGVRPLFMRAGSALIMVAAPPIVLQVAVSGIPHRSIDWAAPVWGTAIAGASFLIALTSAFIGMPRSESQA